MNKTEIFGILSVAPCFADLTFHYFRAPKSIDRHILCSSERSRSTHFASHSLGKVWPGHALTLASGRAGQSASSSLPWNHCRSSFRISFHSLGRRTETRWCLFCRWIWKYPVECRCSCHCSWPPRWWGRCRRKPRRHCGGREKEKTRVKLSILTGKFLARFSPQVLAVSSRANFTEVHQLKSSKE